MITMPNRPCSRLRLEHFIIALLALFWAGSACPQGPAKPVAIAIEFSGKAETQVGGRTVPIALLSEFETGDRLRMHRGARMTVMLYRTGVPYSVEGPSLLKFSDASIITLNGSEPSPLQPISGKDGKPIRIQPNKVTEAATVVRGVARPIRALTAIGGITLETRPTLRWQQVEPGLEYELTLSDSEDKVIFEAAIQAVELELPELEEGEAYRWTIFARAPNRDSYASTYRFSVATALQKEQVENFRPAPEAAAGDKVVYALWLAQSGFLDEAARYRERLAAEGVAWPGAALDKDR